YVLLRLQGYTNPGQAAPHRCRSLSSITLPASVTELGEKIFSNCFSLTAIWVDEGNETYASDESGVL
ncbi:MAG: leucine-rich repeat protein, partial [Oscillospiraceae bacterium]